MSNISTFISDLKRMIPLFDQNQIAKMIEFLKEYSPFLKIHTSDSFAQLIKQICSLCGIKTLQFHFVTSDDPKIDDQVHIFNTSAISKTFDPLFKLSHSADAYMSFLVSFEIKYSSCIFITSTENLQSFTSAFPSLFPYQQHCKLMFNCAKYFKHIDYNDYKQLKLKYYEPMASRPTLARDSPKYVLLCPHLYSLETKMNEDELIIAQDIPFDMKLDNHNYNWIMLKLWNIIVDDDDNDTN